MFPVTAIRPHPPLLPIISPAQHEDFPMNGLWSKVVLAGKPADTYAPHTSPPRFGVLFLHGADQETLVSRPAFTRLFDELRLACVCPHGKLSWWTDRLCPDFDQAFSAERH